MSQDKLLEKLSTSVRVLMTDKFAKIIVESEDGVTLGAKLVSVIAEVLGERLGEIVFPSQWERLLQRKDCPQYMKKMTVANVEAYYPKLALPEEEHWVTFRLNRKEKRWKKETAN